MTPRAIPPLKQRQIRRHGRWAALWKNVREDTLNVLTFKENGTTKGTRRIVNFVSGATLSDDPANDEMEIVIAGGTDTDEKVKVTSNDTVADYLLNKIAAGTGIVKTELNDGGDEDVEIKVNPTVTRTLTLTAAGGGPTTTAGCAEPAKVELATNDVDIWVLDFDQTTAESAFWMLPLPDNYGGGTLVARFYWTAASGSGGVVWGIKARVYAEGDALDQAYGTEVETADTLTTVNDMHISGDSTAITPSGTLAGGNCIQIKVTRKTAHASDTLTADARLLAVKLEYATNAWSD